MYLKEAEKPFNGRQLNPWVAKSLAILLGVSFAIGGTTPASDLFNTQVEAATQFRDDANIRDYSREPIEYLVKTGVIKGYAEDNTFRPQGTLTRIEALSLLMNSVDPSGQARAKIVQDLKNSKQKSGITEYDDYVAMFADTTPEVWGGNAQDLMIVANYIGTGAYHNPRDRVNGKSGYLQPVTRAEFAKMTVAVLEKLGGEKIEIKDNIESVIGDYNKSYTDKSLSTNTDKDTVLSSGYTDAIKKLYSVGIVNGATSQGVENCYLPQTTLTREQAATIVYKAVNKNKRTPLTVAPKPVEEQKPTVTPGTLDLNDPNRRDAVAGDVITVNGQKITLTEKFGVVGAEQPVAVDLGRQGDNGKTVKDHGACSLNGGTVDTYIVSPQGEGHFLESWSRMITGYANSVKNPVKGQTYTFGLGGWCKLTWDGLDFSVEVPSWLPY